MQTECYIYTRVSTQKQVTTGNGLDSQERRCLEYCQQKGYKVLDIFKEEGVSGQDTNRPALNDLLSIIKGNKKEKIILIDDLSRLSRNVAYQASLDVVFQKSNTKLEVVNMEFSNDPTGSLLKNIMTATNQFFAQQNQTQVFNRMRARMQSGQWVLKVPYGYENFTDPIKGKGVRPISEKIEVVKILLEKFASGKLETIADAQRFLSSKLKTKPNQYNYRNKQASRILNNSAFYAGYIKYNRIDKTLKNKIWDIDTKGNHDPIISEYTYQLIQKRLNNKQRTNKTHNSESYPLKGSIHCNGCNSLLTANHATSKSKKRIGYYRCNNFNCNHSKKNINQILVENKFFNYLKDIEFDSDFGDLVKEIVIDIVQKNKKLSVKYKRNLTEKINKLDEKKDNFLDKLSDNKFQSIQSDLLKRIRDINDSKCSYESDLKKLQNKFSEKKVIEEIFKILGNLNSHWSVLSVKSKRNLQELLFPDGFSLNLKEEITTPHLALPFNVFKRNNNEKSNLVEPRGIEPLTSTLPA